MLYSKFYHISFNVVYIKYYVYISTVRGALGFERRRRISGTGGHTPAGRRQQGRRSRDTGSRWPAIRERGVYGTSGKARVAITRARGVAGRRRDGRRTPLDRRARLLGATERRRGAPAPRVADQAGRDCGAVCSERHGQNGPPHPPVSPRPAALPGCICTQRTRRRMMGPSLPAHTAMTQPNPPASPTVHHEERVPAAGCRRGHLVHRKGERLTDANCFRRRICYAACPSAATRRTRHWSAAVCSRARGILHDAALAQAATGCAVGCAMRQVHQRHGAFRVCQHGVYGTAKLGNVQ